MLKHFTAAFIVLISGTTSFAQNPTRQDMRFRDAQRPRSQFSQYLAYGLSAGFEYAAMDGEAKITLKNNMTGVSNSASGSTSSSASALGISVNYSQMPRGKFGFNTGMAVIKKLEDNRNSSGSFNSSGSMLQVRPEGNLVFSLANGLYGGGGLNLSYLDIEGNDNVIAKVGAGIQLQVGFIPNRNLGFDLGYSISRHNLNEMWAENNGVRLVEVDTKESYLDIKQIRARASYMF